MKSKNSRKKLLEFLIKESTAAPMSVAVGTPGKEQSFNVVNANGNSKPTSAVELFNGTYVLDVSDLSKGSNRAFTEKLLSKDIMGTTNSGIAISEKVLFSCFENIFEDLNPAGSRQSEVFDCKLKTRAKPAEGSNLNEQSSSPTPTQITTPPVDEQKAELMKELLGLATAAPRRDSDQNQIKNLYQYTEFKYDGAEANKFYIYYYNTLLAAAKKRDEGRSIDLVNFLADKAKNVNIEPRVHKSAKDYLAQLWGLQRKGREDTERSINLYNFIKREIAEKRRLLNDAHAWVRHIWNICYFEKLPEHIKNTNKENLKIIKSEPGNVAFSVKSSISKSEIKVGPAQVPEQKTTYNNIIKKAIEGNYTHIGWIFCFRSAINTIDWYTSPAIMCNLEKLKENVENVEKLNSFPKFQDQGGPYQKSFHGFIKRKPFFTLKFNPELKINPEDYFTNPRLDKELRDNTESIAIQWYDNVIKVIKSLEPLSNIGNVNVGYIADILNKSMTGSENDHDKAEKDIAAEIRRILYAIKSSDESNENKVTLLRKVYELLNHLSDLFEIGYEPPAEVRMLAPFFTTPPVFFDELKSRVNNAIKDPTMLESKRSKQKLLNFLNEGGKKLSNGCMPARRRIASGGKAGSYADPRTGGKQAYAALMKSKPPGSKGGRTKKKCICCHKCPNDRSAPNGYVCTNPAHLYWGTKADNTYDQNRGNGWASRNKNEGDPDGGKAFAYELMISEDDIRQLAQKIIKEDV